MIGLAVTAVIGSCTLALLGLRSAVVDSMVFGGAAVCDFLQGRPARRRRATAGLQRVALAPVHVATRRPYRLAPASGAMRVCQAGLAPGRTRCARSARVAASPGAVVSATAAVPV